MDEYKKIFLFAEKKHAGQMHANNVPVTHHLARVSECLLYFLNLNREGTVRERAIISLAALGHDILEDTEVKPDEVKNVFGEKCFKLIWGSTNEWGDQDISPYVRKVTAASEEVRLIKLADLADNITSVAYNIAVLGIEWTTSYFLPIVTPMKEAVRRTSFRRYQKTAQDLICIIDLYYGVLLTELERFQSETAAQNN